MTTHSTFWVIVTIFCSVIGTNDGAIAYVRPSSAGNVTCPNQPCLTFNDYAKEKDQYFLDGTLFEFLSGVHQLDLNLTVSNISHCVLEGDGSVQILLSSVVSITFLDSKNITITSLEIFLSGQLDDTSLFEALVLINTTSFLSKLNFFGNDSLWSTAIRTQSSVVHLGDVMVLEARSLYGAALVAFNSTVNFMGQNYFENNTATLGGAMAIVQSFANFHGNISFVNNIAFSSVSASGGAIYCTNSTLYFSSSAQFKHNQVLSVNLFRGKGGGILAHSNSILTFEASSNIVFIENAASGYGGAISVSESELIMHGKALFNSNFAGSGGGALEGEANSRILCNSSGERTVFQNNYVVGLAGLGGAIFTQLSNLELDGILFEKNMARFGGAIRSSDDFSMYIVTCDFYNNSAVVSGGAVSYMGTNGFAVFDGTNNFKWNQANTTGIVSISFGENVTVAGENNFISNNVTLGSGGLSLLSVGHSFIYGNLTFYRNYAPFGGALYGILSNVTICGKNVFTENSAERYGGGMMFYMCNLNITGQAAFFQNTATSAGSAVYINASNANIGGNINISNNFSRSRYSFLEGSLSFSSSIIYLTGVLVLENNTGDLGGAINVRDSEVNVLGCIQCFNNRAYTRGGALLARNSAINFRNYSNINVFQTNAAAERGGAFYAISSTISLAGLQKFLNNSAMQGGAIAIDSSSKLVLSQPLQASFVENNASVGGAIFYDDAFSADQCTEQNFIDRGSCFIELDSTSNIQISFINNTATSAGTILYGGDLDRCKLYVGGGFSDSCGNRIGGTYSYSPVAVIKEISTSTTIDNKTADISSDPLEICYCENGIPDCSDRIIHTLRGKEFTLLALVVGQSGGVIPSSVRTSLDNEIQISAAQRIQTAGKECTPITYRLSSKKNTTSLVLFPDGPCRDAARSRSELTINFLPCPDGFTLDGSECVCELRLQRYTNGCNVDDNSIMRASNTFWMGAIYENGTFEGLILHSGCPFDYCIDTPVLIELDNVDIQCNHNHSGILCGSCLDDYSVTFGTLHCLPCRNAYLALILPFAIAGIVLVAFLLLLNISVASGTINGLIFYANVIQVNRSIFFPPRDTNILTVFIAWLNLDLGVETCFFDGMNTYIFTWLQFIFPLYVWFLIGLMIVLSRFSTKIAGVLGRNPVAALATLFLLSYSKILRTIIVALSFTILEYPGDTHRAVWLYDGNISYFQSVSHIMLGTVAIIVLLLLFLPYTLLLLVGHWLQACSDRWMFSWLNKIMPLMDAYHAPYIKESRYWTGFLLLVRCALFLTFAFNTLGNASGNLLAIVSVTAGLMILSWLRVQVYRNIFNGYLEAAFLLNLCILAAGTYHVKEIGGNQAALAHTSVGIAFVLFVYILLYHMYLCLRTTTLWKKTHSKRQYILNKITKSCNKEDDIEGKIVNIKQKGEMVQLPTVTTIELDACEPLLA